MAYQNHADLAYATVAVPPSPASSGTTLTLASGLGALFPSANFTITVYPPFNPNVPVNPLHSNAEICLCTSRTGDVLTIVRAQSTTSAKNIGVGWQVAVTAASIIFTDIENSIIQFISAGTTKASASEVVFSNSNGVSFGASGNTITCAIPAGAAAGSLSAGTSSMQLGQVDFANSNGVTFGLSNGTLTASVSVAAAGVAISAGSQVQTAGTANFVNSNGITFGMSNSSDITASHNGLTSQSAQAASASNGSFAFQTLSFTNANNVTFGTSAGGIIFASVATAAAGNSINVSASNSSNNVSQIVFSASNGVSFGLNGSTITASHNGLTSQSNQAASASNGSFTFQTLNFSDANGITFGSSAGGIISASHNGLTSQSAQAASASNGSFTFQTLAFSNANGVTFGTSAGSIVTASVNTTGGGAGVTMSNWEPVPLLAGATTAVAATAGANTGAFDLMALASPVSFNSIQFMASATAQFTPASVTTTLTANVTHQIQYMLYSRSVTDSGATNFSNSSLLVSYASVNWTMQVFSTGSSSSKSAIFSWQTNSTGGTSSTSITTNSSNLVVSGFTGRILMGIPFAALAKAGDNWVGRIYSSSGNGAGAAQMFQLSIIDQSWNNNSTNRSSLGDAGGGNVDGNNLFKPGHGYYTVSSVSLATSLNIVADIRNEAFAPTQGYRYFLLKA